MGLELSSFWNPDDDETANKIYFQKTIPVLVLSKCQDVQISALLPNCQARTHFSCQIVKLGHSSQLTLSQLSLYLSGETELCPANHILDHNLAFYSLTRTSGRSRAHRPSV